jgi:beta-phosphoglucomutase-like phosphatase (HAD superfamily)
VLIDMDGLLLDSEPLWEVVQDEFCKRRGARYDEEAIVACVGRGIRHSAIYLAERFGFEGDPDAHVAEIVDDFAARVPTVSACEGAEQLLRALAGRVPIALGTSSATHVVQAALGARGWLPLFDAIVTGSDVAHPKPAPDIYLEAARRLGVDPTRCVVLEDSLAGTESGKAAGAKVLAVSGPAHRPLPDALVRLADHAVRDLVAALAWIEGGATTLATQPRHGDHTPGTLGAV